MVYSRTSIDALMDISKYPEGGLWTEFVKNGGRPKVP